MLARAPIRLRLTLWYVLLLAIILAAFAAGVYLLLRHSLYQNLDESVQSRAGALVNVVQLDDAEASLTIRAGSVTSGQRERFIRLFDAAGDVRFVETSGEHQIPVDRGAVSAALAGRPTTRSTRYIDDDDRIRVAVVPVVRQGAVVGALEVGEPEEDVVETLSSLLLVMGIAYPVALALAGFGGMFLAGRALSPIDSITTAARDITAEDLSGRLELRLPDDEVGRLARTFDEMIARLDDAFRRQRQFAADASHELRTPLTVIKGQIDVSLQRDREPEAYQGVLRAVNEEVDRLIRLAGSLLTLTRADGGQIPLAFEAVDVGDLVAGVVEQLRPAAGDQGVDLRLDTGPPVTMEADQDLLIQLMLNVLDNAIKYTPNGGLVNAGWGTNGQRVELRVRDTGPGIAAEDIPYVFDRFYRADKARSRAAGGVGLGLAISRWIAEAHGGSIHVVSTLGEGSTFTVSLPTSRS